MQKPVPPPKPQHIMASSSIRSSEASGIGYSGLVLSGPRPPASRAARPNPQITSFNDAKFLADSLPDPNYEPQYINRALFQQPAAAPQGLRATATPHQQSPITSGLLDKPNPFRPLSSASSPSPFSNDQIITTLDSARRTSDELTHSGEHRQSRLNSPFYFHESPTFEQPREQHIHFHHHDGQAAYSGDGRPERKNTYPYAGMPTSAVAERLQTQNYRSLAEEIPSARRRSREISGDGRLRYSAGPELRAAFDALSGPEDQPYKVSPLAIPAYRTRHQPAPYVPEHISHPIHHNTDAVTIGRKTSSVASSKRSSTATGAPNPGEASSIGASCSDNTLDEAPSYGSNAARHRHLHLHKDQLPIDTDIAKNSEKLAQLEVRNIPGHAQQIENTPGEVLVRLRNSTADESGYGVMIHHHTHTHHHHHFGGAVLRRNSSKRSQRPGGSCYDDSDSDIESLRTSIKARGGLKATPPRKNKKSVGQLKRRSSYHVTKDHNRHQLDQSVFRKASLDVNPHPAARSPPFATHYLVDEPTSITTSPEKPLPNHQPNNPIRPRNLSLRKPPSATKNVQPIPENGNPDPNNSQQSTVKRRTWSMGAADRHRNRHSYLMATDQSGNLMTMGEVQQQSPGGGWPVISSPDVSKKIPGKRSRIKELLTPSRSPGKFHASAVRESPCTSEATTPTTTVVNSSDLSHTKNLTMTASLPPGSYLNDTTSKLSMVLSYKCRMISDARKRENQQSGYSVKSRKMKSNWRQVFLVLRYDRHLYFEDVENCKVANYCELLPQMLDISEKVPGCVTSKSVTKMGRTSSSSTTTPTKSGTATPLMSPSAPSLGSSQGSMVSSGMHVLQMSSPMTSVISSCLSQLESPLDLTLCLADISYKQKRKHAFLVQSRDGSEYLFQANSSESCLNWIQLIRDSNNPNEGDETYVNLTLIKQKAKQKDKKREKPPSTRNAAKTPKHLKTTISNPLNVTNLPNPLTPGKAGLNATAPQLMTPGSDALDDKLQRLASGEFESATIVVPTVKSSTTASHWKRIKSRLKSTPSHDQRSGGGAAARAAGADAYRHAQSEDEGPAYLKEPPLPGSTFGNALEACPMGVDDQFVPRIVEVCCQCVEKHGLTQAGIYRIPGNGAAKRRLIKDINSKGLDNTLADDERFQDSNLMASLLKEFFRNLKDPIFTMALYEDFMRAGNEEDSKARMQKIKRTIAALPAVNFSTLAFLCHHLKNVSDNSDKNRMPTKNIAMIFGPTLFISTNGSQAKLVSDINNQWKILSSIIGHVEYFFGPAVKTANDVHKSQDELDYINVEPNKLAALIESRTSNTASAAENEPSKSLPPGSSSATTPSNGLGHSTSDMLDDDVYIPVEDHDESSSLPLAQTSIATLLENVDKLRASEEEATAHRQHPTSPSSHNNEPSQAPETVDSQDRRAVSTTVLDTVHAERKVSLRSCGSRTSSGSRSASRRSSRNSNLAKRHSIGADEVFRESTLTPVVVSRRESELSARSEIKIDTTASSPVSVPQVHRLPSSPEASGHFQSDTLARVPSPFQIRGDTGSARHALRSGCRASIRKKHNLRARRNSNEMAIENGRVATDPLPYSENQIISNVVAHLPLSSDSSPSSSTSALPPIPAMTRKKKARTSNEFLQGQPPINVNKLLLESGSSRCSSVASNSSHSMGSGGVRFNSKVKSSSGSQQGLETGGLSVFRSSSPAQRTSSALAGNAVSSPRMSGRHHQTSAMKSFRMRDVSSASDGLFASPKKCHSTSLIPSTKPLPLSITARPQLRQSLGSRPSQVRRSLCDPDGHRSASPLSRHNTSVASTASQSMSASKSTVQDQLRTLIAGHTDISRRVDQDATLTKDNAKSFSQATKVQNTSSPMLSLFESSSKLLDEYETSTISRRRRSTGVSDAFISNPKSLVGSSVASLIQTMPTVQELGKDHQSAFERLGIGSKSPSQSSGKLELN